MEVFAAWSQPCREIVFSGLLGIHFEKIRQLVLVHPGDSL
jgi:hypothetical protein